MMRLRSYKHIAPCPVCKQPLPACQGHSPRAWQLHADRQSQAAPQPTGFFGWRHFDGRTSFYKDFLP